jgi:transcriptional regulator with XRE-family HTH domain
MPRVAIQPAPESEGPRPLTDIQEIARRLRGLRKTNGLTLKQAAARAGVTDTCISLVERGLSEPSISTLKRILKAYGTTIAAFFADPIQSGKVVISRDERIRMGFPGAHVLSEILTHRVSDKKMLPLYERYQPGSGTQGFCTHEGEEFGLVIAGEIELNLNGTRHRMLPGDSFYYHASIPHSFANVGAAEAEMIVVMTPPSF